MYHVVKETISNIKQSIPAAISKIFYFSDGCAVQYKNCKNFVNVCNHSKDFGIECSWSFFATSLGKSPCDGIGGAIKRSAARASLQRPLSDQILTAQQMYEYCKEQVINVQAVFLSEGQIEATRSFLKLRFESANTLPGTRGFHIIFFLRKSANKNLDTFKKLTIWYIHVFKINFIPVSTNFLPSALLKKILCF